jgi:hypothetical protein
MPDNIGGTVIQRSFVGRGVANVIHIATVPSDELGVTDTALEDVVSELLGVPRESVLSDRDYSRFARDIQHPPDYFWPIWHLRAVQEYERRLKEFSAETSAKAFVGDFISLVSSPAAPASFILFSFAQREERLSKRVELHDDAFHLALSCLSARLEKRSDVQAFYDEMLTYDIPLGQSPETKGDSLLKLLETSKKVCIAPLALGGAQGINLLAQGNYVAALLTTGTAGVMTLVLIGTVSVGSIIVQRVAQRRRSRTQRRNRESEES